MRNLFLLSALFCMVIVTMLFNSCQKEASSTNENSNKEIIAKVNAWLDSQKSPNQPNKAANIELLKENLAFGSARTEQLDNKHDFLVLPIKDDLINKKNFDKHSTLTLLLITDKVGKISSGSIVYFQPSDGEKLKLLPENTFSNLFNGKKVTINGTYKMLTVSGRWISQFETKNGKLFSTGTIQQKEESNKGTQASKTTGCIDWYLVTTFHWADGTTTQTSEYIGTTCDNCDDPNEMSLCPDGGGGGDGPGPDDIVTGEDEAITTSSATAPDPNTGLSGSSILSYTFHALCEWEYDFTDEHFDYITQYKPFPVPVSQVFTDDNGNPATFFLNVLDDWSASKTPLTTRTVLVSWSFLYTQTFVYTTGTRGPFTFSDGFSKVIGP